MTAACIKPGCNGPAAVICIRYTIRPPPPSSDIPIPFMRIFPVRIKEIFGTGTGPRSGIGGGGQITFLAAMRNRKKDFREN
jgi:hypothetical protein